MAEDDQDSIRDKIVLPSNEANPLKIEIARSMVDLEAAYKLVYESYLEKGFTQKSVGQRRLSLFDFLPTTTTFVGKINGQVVGTIRTIQSQSLGIPSAELFDLNPFGQRGENLIEAGSLAVTSEYRNSGGALFFQLARAVLLYGLRFTNSDTMFISINPSQAKLYREILLFSEYSPVAAPLDCHFANGAPALGFFRQLKTLRGDLLKCYRGRDFEKNLHDFIFSTPADPVQWPERDFFVSEDPVLTPEKLQHLVELSPEVTLRSSLEQRLKLRNFFNLPEYAKIFHFLGIPKGQQMRKSQRYKFKGACWIKQAAGYYPVVEVSRDALVLADQPGTRSPPERFTADIIVGRGRVINISGRIQNRYKGQIVIAVQKPHRHWDEFIDLLSQRYLTEPRQELENLNKVA